MTLPGTCDTGVRVAEAILWVRLAVAILIRRAFAVPDKGVPVDYALSKIANTACVGDVLTMLDFLTVSGKTAFVPKSDLSQCQSGC